MLDPTLNLVECHSLLLPILTLTPQYKPFVMEIIQRKRFPDIPNASNLTANRSCRTVSKALAKAV